MQSSPTAQRLRRVLTRANHTKAHDLVPKSHDHQEFRPEAKRVLLASRAYHGSQHHEFLKFLSPDHWAKLLQVGQPQRKDQLVHWQRRKQSAEFHWLKSAPDKPAVCLPLDVFLHFLFVPPQPCSGCGHEELLILLQILAE